MRAVGLAGTAKNTGKTTAMNAILAEAVRTEVRAAITSIGYDGEEFDHITGLPKPRVTVTPGTLVATAEGTLRGATARYELLGGTGVLTALGEVVLVRVEESGLIPLAGPPTGAGVLKVVDRVAGYPVDLCMVDGAFGRMAPMAVLDGVVIATGGARSRDVDRLVRETAALGWIFSLPATPAPTPDGAAAAGWATAANLLSLSTAEGVLAALQAGTRELLVTGAVTAEALEALAGWNGWSVDARVVFADPIRLALAGEPVRVRTALELLAQRARLGVAHPVALASVTVNPFYPEADPGGTFRAGYLDAGRLRLAVAAATHVPVVDVVFHGGEQLLRVIMGNQ